MRTQGSRSRVLGASAAALCLAAALAGCGSASGDDGYVAVGAAGATPDGAPGKVVPPEGKVEFVPLDGSDARGGGDSGGDGKPGSDGRKGSSGKRGDDGKSSDDGGSSGTPGSSELPDAPAGGDSRTPGSPGGSSGSSGSSGSTSGSSSHEPSGGGGDTDGGPASSAPPGSTAPSGPAVLKTGAPRRAAASDRWCEKVTVAFRNTGGKPVRSGTVTFATHIIGALGVDWATIESTRALPAPIGAGDKREKTWTVCVDSWRVPLGMHIETKDVTAKWR